MQNQNQTAGQTANIEVAKSQLAQPQKEKEKPFYQDDAWIFFLFLVFYLAVLLATKIIVDFALSQHQNQNGSQTQTQTLKTSKHRRFR